MSTIRLPLARVSIDAVMALLGIAVLVGATLWSQRPGVDVGDTQMRNTIRLALCWYAVALCLMMRLHPIDWTAASRTGRVARWCWTWAFVCFLIHVGMAFHYFHHWSHTQAVEHNRQVSGVGEGVYVSYVFTLLWAADVAYWWLWPVRFAQRSIWIDRALHSFMLFIVFNATVVFETGLIRWASVFTFLSLMAVWSLSRNRFHASGKLAGSSERG